jgi:drug/metabolite transporter (DMT)-like permease
MALAKDTVPREEHVVIGMLAAAGAIFMFNMMTAFAKYLSSGLSVVEIAFYRNLVACIPFLILIFGFGRREILVVRSKPHFIALRAILGTVTLIATFAAFSLMPMAETVVFLFTASLFAPVLGVLILHERVGPWRWSAVIIGFIGVAIMADPGGSVSALGVGIALLAAFLQAVMSIILRHLGGHESPETITFYFFVIGVFVTGLAMPFVATGPGLEDVPYLFGVGLSGALAQWLYSLALRHLPAAVVAVFNYSSIIWATILGWLIWNEWPMPIVFAGSAVVITSNLLIVWRESRFRRLPGPV